ncbi:uncharacterized protein FIBRA_00308 [Fibroporia radiculosa]|uniref:F-box domain-containing protein n=1 Tax=Fibroporia radiculosa TaxID=599839 RepID=J7S5Z0_9APHY|nr:uncharacterized protein FIBRA_00308 [Fibroporia radiculosa]CCL98314.1 predicted protein [Fibroporia radiculosa]
MDTGNVPSELWMDIFELLPSPSDLYSITQTCKRFHALAVRAIHRHVIWRSARQVENNLPVWNFHQGMDVTIHTLELGVSVRPPAVPDNLPVPTNPPLWPFQPVNHPMAFALRLHNTISYHRLDLERFSSQTLHAAMLQRIFTFVNLHKLVFSNVIFSDDHFAIIHALPQLRTLRIDHCIMPSPHQLQQYDHATLPITDLILLNWRRQVSEHHGEVLVEEDMTPVLNLALAQNLHTLRVDSTADVFRYVFHWHIDAQAPLNDIPPHLERLYVQRKQLLQPSVPGESTFPDTSLYSFLQRAHTLTTYSTFHPAPQHQHLMPDTLPLLRCYSGPVESIAGILPGRPLEAVQLLSCVHGQSGVHNHRDGIPALTAVAEESPELLMLSVEFSTWDDEIMHAICALFPKLRRLKITYEGAGPSELTMVTMGPEFLSRLPDLHTLQLFTLSNEGGSRLKYPAYLFDPSYESVEEEMRNLVIPWNRWCPALREVQLASGYTLLRGFTGGYWQIQRLKRAEEIEEFYY